MLKTLVPPHPNPLPNGERECAEFAARLVPDRTAVARAPE